MARTIKAYRNVTKAYVPDYDHLDEHEPMGFSARVVAGRQFWKNEGYVMWVYVRTSRPVSFEEFVEFSYTNFNRGCSCERDCCGHLFGGASMADAKSNKLKTRWAVPLHYAQNY